MLSPKLQLKVAQKQILTPGLVQMVTVLQLNRLELKEMINQEMVNNPVLDDSLESGEEITPEELLAAAHITLESEAPEVVAGAAASQTEGEVASPETTESIEAAAETADST